MGGIIPIGELDAASDLTMAYQLSKQSESRDAVDARVQGVAAGIIAADGTVVAAAADAVDQAVSDVNALRAYPETAVTRAATQTLPMQWVQRTLSDPYAATYTAAYAGSWSGTAARAGTVPVLSSDGQIAPEQVPAQYPTRNDVVGLIEAALLRSTGKFVAREVRAEFPILAGRISQARKLGLPAPVVFTGSSTSARTPGYIVGLTRKLQSMIELPPGQTPTGPQFNTDAIFTEMTAPGVHVYSAAIGGARSGNYLNNAQRERIAALDPAMIHHMIGANDFRDQASVASYKANVVASLNHFDTVLTEPCQHVLVHPYQSLDISSPTIPWASYGAALQEIASTRPDTVFVDISAAYIANGVPGSDPLSLISSDLVHQSDTGYDLMTELLAQTYLA